MKPWIEVAPSLNEYPSKFSMEFPKLETIKEDRAEGYDEEFEEPSPNMVDQN